MSLSQALNQFAQNLGRYREKAIDIEHSRKNRIISVVEPSRLGVPPQNFNSEEILRAYTIAWSYFFGVANSG